MHPASLSLLLRRYLRAALVIALVPPLAYSNPTQGSVAAGQATITAQGSTTTISQSSARAIINWRDFSIGAGETTRFVQPDSTSAVLNRVTGGNPSRLLGRLEANGSVYLINPNGVLVGREGVIATGGTFAAATRDVDDGAFLRGERGLTFRGSSEGGVENLGTITAAEGDAILVGRTVSQAGNVTASRGTAILAAGDEVILQPQADDTLRVRFTVPGAVGAKVENTGVIQAAQAELAARGGRLLDLAVRSTGTVSATAVEERGGRIFLTASEGSADVSGTLEATRAVTVLGEGTTRFSGAITTGERGFAEVSGKGHIDFTGSVNTHGGSLLIDPTDVTIDNAMLATLSTQLANQAVTVYASGNISYTAIGNATVGLFPVTGSGYTFTLNADQNLSFAAGSRLNLTGAAADLQLYANGGNITIGAGASIAMTGGQALLRATRDVTLEDSASITFASGGRFLAVADSSAFAGVSPNLTSVPQDRVGRLTLGGAATITAAKVQLFAVKPTDFVNTSSYTPAAPTYNTLDSDVNLATAGSGLWFQSNASGTFGGSTTTLTITADSKSKTYGAPLPSFTASYAGLLNGDTPSVVTGLQFSTTATVGSNVGTYAITPFGASAPASYTLAYVSGLLTVNPAPLTIAANNASKVYGAAMPVFDATFTGFVNGDTRSVVSGFSLTSTATAGSPVGSYGITAAGATAANYAITYQPATLDVTRAPLVVRADNKTKTYGAALPAFTASVGGLTNGDNVAAAFTGLQFSTTATAASNVGTFAITPGGATSANYSLNYVPGTLTIDRAPLTIRADSFTQAVGAALPTFTASYVGLVNGDSSAVVSGLTLSSTATAASPGGIYPITPAGATAANYNISFLPGTLTLTGGTVMPLTLQAANAARFYGDSNPAFSLLPATGLLTGDSVASVQFATAASLGSNVGTYTITPSNAVIASPAANAYSISYLPGVLTINPAPLTVRAPDVSTTYGTPALNAPVIVTGLKNGQSAANVIDPGFMSYSTTATRNSPVGTYQTFPTVGLGSSNYTIDTRLPGTLTINPAPLRVEAVSFSRSYGDANQPLGALVLGLQNSESAANVVSYSLSTSATSASGVGRYPISVAGSLLSPNYSLTTVPGAITINPAPLTLRVDDVRKTYGDPLPALSFGALSGLKNGDAAAAVVNFGTPTTPATSANAAAGTYAITAAGAQSRSPNYTLTVQPGTLTIDRAPLTMRAADASRDINQPNPAFTASYTGFKLGETEAVLTNVGLTTTATASSPQGLYPITPTATSANYAITFIPGTLSIAGGLNRSLTLQAADVRRYYGQENPTLTLLPPLGLAAGDSVTSVKLTTTATLGSNVGAYTITPSDAVLSRPSGSEYVISYLPGTLTIDPQVLRFQLNTFLASDYGDPLARPFFAVTSPTAKNIPSSGFGLNGIYNGDTITVDGISAQLAGFGLGLPSGRLAAGVYRTAGELGTLLTGGVANPNIRLELGTVVPYQVRQREFSLTLLNHTTTYGHEVTQNEMPFTTQGALPGSVGLVPGDTLADAFSLYVFTGLPEAKAPVGYYEVRFGFRERADSNYRFTGSNTASSVSVVAAPLVANVSVGRFTYGSPIPLSYTLSGFVDESDRALVTGSFNYQVDVERSQVRVGLGSLQVPNYFINFPSAVPAQIDPTTLTISGSPVAALRGAAIPQPIVLFDGFVNGEGTGSPRFNSRFLPSSFTFTPRYNGGVRPGNHEIEIRNKFGDEVPGYHFVYKNAPFLLQELIPATMKWEATADGITKVIVTEAKVVDRPDHLRSLENQTVGLFGLPPALMSQYGAIIDHYNKANAIWWNGNVEEWIRLNGSNVELIGRMTGSVLAVLTELARPERAATLTDDQRMFLVYMQEKIRSEKMVTTANAYNDYLAWKIESERVTDTQGPNLLTMINYGWDRVPPDSYLQRAQAGMSMSPEMFFTWATMLAQSGHPEIVASAVEAASRDAESRGESAVAVMASMGAGLSAAGMTASSLNSLMPFMAGSAGRAVQDGFMAATTARLAAQAAAQAATQSGPGWVPGLYGSLDFIGSTSNATRSAITAAVSPIAESTGLAGDSLGAARTAISSAAITSIGVGVITTVASVILNKAISDVVKITTTENEMGAALLRCTQTPIISDMAKDGSLILYLAKFSAEQIEQRQRYAENVLDLSMPFPEL